MRSLRLKHIGTEQMIRKIDIIHKFITLYDYPNLVFSLVDSYQLAAEITTSILENIHGNTSYVTSLWIDNLIKDLHHHRIKFKKRDKSTLKPDRYNDTNVIQDVNNKYISILTRKKYNASRMYLRIIFLSKVCNSEGTSLNMIKLQNTANHRVNNIFWWPNQQKPGVKYWNDWISYLLKKYCVPNSHHLQQQYHLGKWLTEYNNRNSHSNINFPPSLQGVYNTQHLTQHYCKHTGAGTYSIIPNTSASIETIHVDAIRITMKNKIFNCSSRASPIAKTFPLYIKAMPEWK